MIVCLMYEVVMTKSVLSCVLHVTTEQTSTTTSVILLSLLYLAFLFYN